ILPDAAAFRPPTVCTPAGHTPMPRHPFRSRILLVAIGAMAAAPAFAQPLPQRIDALIAAGTPDYAKKAAAIASDDEYLRRVTLALPGFFPGPAEARAFLDDKSQDKRGKLIAGLRASPEYARHMTYRFDTLLMDRRPDKHVPAVEWRKFLTDTFTA